MRVLAVTHRYPPRSLVGAWIATHRFLAHLAAAGHTVTVFAHRDRDSRYTHDGVTVETGLRGRSHAHRLARDADILISHCGDVGLPAEVARRSGLPHVRMVHGHGSADTETADLLVFNSRAMATSTPHDVPSIVCHPYVDPDQHRVDTVGELITIVNCSRPKGIKTAWRCAEHLPGHDFLGILGGYGEQVRPRARNFTVEGTTSDMRTVWSRTRLLLVPSIAEAWGMVGVEAMCSGIPVIAHPTPGLRESLGSAGIFCDRDDTDSWVDAIRRLDDPAEYSRAARLARSRADALTVVDDSRTVFAAAVEQLAR